MTGESAAPRFEDVTETSGVPLTQEAASMMYTRYRHAADRATGRSVLEIGCGAGPGLGLIARSAHRVVAGDITLPLLRHAQAHYGTRFPFLCMSAEHLPFLNGSFDLVLFFEVAYYVGALDQALSEIARVLTSRGEVLVVSANPEWPGFIPSPYSVHYNTADELRAALDRCGLIPTTAGAFPTDRSDDSSVRNSAAHVAQTVRRVLDRAGLIPKTLKGRAWLKRLLHRRLVQIPLEIPDDFASVAPLQPVGPGSVPRYKVIYATGCKPLNSAT